MTPRHLFMKIRPLAGALGLSALAVGGPYGQVLPRGGEVLIPESSQEGPTDIGNRAHTNLKMYFPHGGIDNLQPPSFSGGARPQESPPYGGYIYETPASLACVYKLVSSSDGACSPNDHSILNPPGGSRAIAIVDYPTAVQDLQVFSAQFGLPMPTTGPNGNFQVVYASGRQPPVNANWNLEAALDIQWAHAMAPNAKIYLIEAASNSWANLMAAVSVANSLLAPQGGEVSMSWGGSEFTSQTYYDNYFTQPGVVYFAAAGDSPGVWWPSVSPNVVSVGGTSVSRNPTTGAFQRELAWQSTGGGPSRYEPRPSYQNGISAIVQTRRGTPDVAAVADPSTGVWVYYAPYWWIFGGTSVATPVWAGIVNSAGSFSASSQIELTTVYKNLGNASDLADIVLGSCGPNQGYLAGAGWDFCTGVGSPVSKLGK
jgi:kumamolisin